jgi:PKD repeat protein
MMKKNLGILICTLMIIATVIPVGASNSGNRQNNRNTIIVNELMQPSGKSSCPITLDLKTKTILPASKIGSLGNYPVPEYHFIKTPTSIMKSYYDYMPSGYTTYPIQLQTEHGNGQYITFHAKPAATGNRRQYYAYVSNTYAIQSGTINPVNQNEGYGSIAIHPATGDAISSWHETTGYTTQLTYDNFDAAETPGAWQSPLTVPTTAGMQYIWPVMYSGPSPQGTGYVRIYQVSNNALALPDGDAVEDARILYADVANVNGADLSNLLSLATWHNVTVFTSWRDKECRPFQSFAIDYNHPGKVAFIGWATWLKGDMGNMLVSEGIFVWESTDYGQTWSTTNLHSDGPGAAIYKVTNPGFSGAPAQLDVTATGYHNTALYDKMGNLHWTFMQAYGYSDSLGSYYFPAFLPQAEAVWDGSSFTFHEVPELPGFDLLSGHTVPWTDSEHLYPVVTWSTNPPGDSTAIFHENKQQQAINKQNNWLVQLWADGTYSWLGTNGDPNYATYIYHPILFISVSPDNGNTWSEPIKLTDINSQLFNFSQQITVYPYLCDQITDLGDRWGQIYLTYFDDNDWGSNVQSQGSNTGGNITYCSLKIKFPEVGSLIVDAGGPYADKVNEPTQFIGSAVGGFKPYTWHWDFGDNTSSNEKNPLHTYSTVGKYNVSLTVVDSSTPPNQMSDTTTATITHRIAIKIKGGLGISAVINNTGGKDLTNVTWSILFNGGFAFPREKTGVLLLFPSGNETTLNMIALGFGKLTITVKVRNDEVTTTGFLFLIFVMGVIS